MDIENASSTLATDTKKGNKMQKIAENLACLVFGAVLIYGFCWLIGLIR